MESADGHAMGVPGEFTIVANSQLTDKPITRYHILLATHLHAELYGRSPCHSHCHCHRDQDGLCHHDCHPLTNSTQSFPPLDHFYSASVGPRIRRDYWRQPPSTRPSGFAWPQICPRKTDFFKLSICYLQIQICLI